MDLPEKRNNGTAGGARFAPARIINEK